MQLAVRSAGEAAPGLEQFDEPGSAGARPDRVCRTETAPLAINPEFQNSAFVLRLPQALGSSLKPTALLTCSIWAAPTMERGRVHVRSSPQVLAASLRAARRQLARVQMTADGREADELLGQATVSIAGDMAARLLRSERVTVPVLMEDMSSRVTGAGPQTIMSIGARSLASCLPGSRAAPEAPVASKRGLAVPCLLPRIPPLQEAAARRCCWS